MRRAIEIDVFTFTFNEGCNSCASLAGLVLCFIACFMLLVIAALQPGDRRRRRIVRRRRRRGRTSRPRTPGVPHLGLWTPSDSGNPSIRTPGVPRLSPWTPGILHLRPRTPSDSEHPSPRTPGVPRRSVSPPAAAFPARPGPPRSVMEFRRRAMGA